MFVIIFTFVFALLLAAMPLPDAFLWVQPEWATMVLIYWCIALPHRVGVFAGFFLGLCMDLLDGSLLGQNALAMSVIAYVALILYQRMRNYGALQQAMMVGLLISISLLIFQWVQNLTSVAADTLAFLLPAITSMLLWPWFFIGMRTIRRRFQIH
ncbi:MAG: rod shape-determining protein MreD [Oceanospirillum sp.]|nr:rod shape-determining protein MreD [Oceanospirillum sp.]MDX1397236.1 rod shape-determining protein MreD [Oceanospirillum sp.]